MYWVRPPEGSVLPGVAKMVPPAVVDPSGVAGAVAPVQVGAGAGGPGNLGGAGGGAPVVEVDSASGSVVSVIVVVGF